MKSPLATYKQNATKFGITAEHNVEDVAKLTFAREQAQQMQHLINRLLFDLATTAIHLEDAKDENTKAAYRQKTSDYERDLRQTKSALDIALELVKELEDAVGSED